MSNLSTDNIVAESTMPYLHLDLAGVDGVDPYSIGLGRALHLDRLSEQAYASLRGAIAG